MSLIPFGVADKASLPTFVLRARPSDNRLPPVASFLGKPASQWR